MYGSAAPTSFSYCDEIVTACWAIARDSSKVTNMNFIIILDPSIIVIYIMPRFLQKDIFKAVIVLLYSSKQYSILLRAFGPQLPKVINLY